MKNDLLLITSRVRSHLLHLRTKLLITICALMTSCATIHSNQSKAESNSGLLRITATASTKEIRLKEPFKVALRVENRSKTNQTIRVMTCSWDQHWKSSNPAVSWIPWDCSNNFAVDVNLAPNEAYTNQLEMIVQRAEPFARWVPFRMGFTPLENTNTLWSNEIWLKIDP